MESRPAAERFWSKVDKAGPVPAGQPGLGRCWVWTAGTFRYGYGCFRHRGRMEKAHRLAFEWAYGPFLPVLRVLHRCDNPACVRPEHLYLGTVTENGGDCSRRRRNRRSRNRGEANAQAKLTEAQVRAIRRRYAAGGISEGRLAAEYSLSGAQVSMIVTRRRWTHVP